MCLRGRLSLVRGPWWRERRWRQAGSSGDIEGVEIDALNIRLLQHEEVPSSWQIDRREVVKNIYYLRNREVILKPDYFDIQDWPSGEAELYTTILLDCYDRAGSVGMTERGTKGFKILKFITMSQSY